MLLTAPALDLVDTTPACSRCIENGGLCVGCAAGDRAILPQLAVPSWVRLIQKRDPATLAKPVVESPEGRRIRERRERKRARLARALAGEHTKVRR